MNLDSVIPANAKWRKNMDITVGDKISPAHDTLYHSKSRTEWPISRQIVLGFLDKITLCLWGTHDRKS